MICEKPSLMKQVRECYNNHKAEVDRKLGGDVEFIALHGHICTNYEPDDYDCWHGFKWGEVDYPMIPETWGIKMIDTDYNKKVVSQIKSEMSSYQGFIVGTDSDVEGYGIYYLLEHYLGLEKKKTYRFVEHSLTDKEILESLLTMTDYHTDELHKRFVHSFLIRSRVDWLYGMNATRMMSIKMNDLTAIGRVKTPTIKLVYDNSMAIDNFKPENYYILEADYDGWTAQYTEDDKNAKHFKSPDDVPGGIPDAGQVVSVETKRVNTHAPKLYDLAAIQTEAGSKYGYKPNETLEIIQSLYEKHKVISYPRTQCRYVSTEKSREFPQMVKQMSVFDELRDVAAGVSTDAFIRVSKDKEVVNDSEVTKESHDALLPTSVVPNLSEMTKEEVNICRMIYTRLLAQFLPPLSEDKTTLITKHGEYHFVARGKAVVNKGWRVLYDGTRDSYLPSLSKGAEVTSKEFKLAKKTTQPPRRLTQATLINAMEHIDSVIEDKELKKSLAESKGIGTSATRANIIVDIIKRGYVEEDKKGGLHITSVGIKYIKAVETLDITSPVFAAKMDVEMKKIQRGETEYDTAYEDMIDHLYNMCNQIDEIPEQEEIVDASCIKCGRAMTSDRYGYVCRECKVRVPKMICGKVIDDVTLRTIMDGGKTDSMMFKSKQGKQFSAKLYWNADEEKVAFDFSSGLNCPYCGNEVKLNKGGAFCDCGLKLFRNCRGKFLNDDEIKKLLNGESLMNVSCKKKDGSKFRANIRLNESGETELFWD